MKMLSRMLLSATFLAAVTLLAGCGEDLPELVNVTGTVTMDGKPLANATVIFEPENDRASQGVTDEQGRYELLYKVGAPGAVVGKHTVRISKYEGGGEGEEEEEDAATMDEESSLVPAAYNEQSELTADVKPDKEDGYDFNLDSSGEAGGEEADAATDGE